MPVTEAELGACKETTSASAEYVIKSGLALRKCDATTTRLESLELEAGVEPKEEIVGDRSIESWFDEGSRLSPRSRLRLLHASEDEAKDLPFTRKAWVIISEHMDLNLDHFHMIRREDRSRLTSFWKDRRVPEDVCDAHFLKVQGAVASWTFISCLVLIHHRPSTNTTHGLIVTRGEKASFTGCMLSQLKTQHARLGPHPLFTATILWKCVVAEHSGDSLRMWKDVAAMNGRLNGFVPENYYTTGKGSKGAAHDSFQWATERVDSLDRMKEERKPRKIDYLRETKVAQSLALEQSFFLEILNKQGMMMKRVLGELDKEAKSADDSRLRIIEDIHSALTDVETDNQAQIGHVRRNQADMNTMSQMLFHFMALEEGRLSTELAASSKDIAESSMRDASAMKSISILTMVFLPATAAASVFSTPFFDWNDDRNSLAVRGFRVFWIVTIPLTCVVLMVWILAVKMDWTSWRNRLPGVDRGGEGYDEMGTISLRLRAPIDRKGIHTSDNTRSKV